MHALITDSIKLCTVLGFWNSYPSSAHPSSGSTAQSIQHQILLSSCTTRRKLWELRVRSMEDTFAVCLSCVAEDVLLCFACVVCSRWFSLCLKEIGILQICFTKPQQINTDLFQTILQMIVLQMPPHSMQRFRYAGNWLHKGCSLTRGI